MATCIGVISDTHGLVRDEALRYLKGSALILHAGDIGGPEVLARLGEVAPVHAVRGNNDAAAWAQAIPEELALTVESVRLHVTHILADIAPRIATLGCDVLVTGHSHKPALLVREEVRCLNPGSAGPRRFKLPIAAGKIWVREGTADIEVRDLLDGARLL
jgi:putative phosphoesterase